MGDRVLIQVKDGEEYSAVCYLHNGGSEAPNLIKVLAKYMEGRYGDCSYAAARLIGLAHQMTPGNLSLGVFTSSGKLTESDSHGDAGVYIVDCNTWDVEAIGGYGEPFNTLV